MRSQGAINKALGSAFEEIFVRQARSNGLLARHNYLTARRIYQGKLRVVESNLDFTLISQKGQVGFVDTKTWAQDYFTFSQITPHQVDLATSYNNWSVPAGFVCYFRPSGRVVFYSGHEIARGGPRTRFQSFEGRWLGNISDFDLRSILSV